MHLDSIYSHINNSNSILADIYLHIHREYIYINIFLMSDFYIYILLSKYEKNKTKHSINQIFIKKQFKNSFPTHELLPIKPILFKQHRTSINNVFNKKSFNKEPAIPLLECGIGKYCKYTLKKFPASIMKPIITNYAEKILKKSNEKFPFEIIINRPNLYNKKELTASLVSG